MDGGYWIILFILALIMIAVIFGFNGKAIVPHIQETPAQTTTISQSGIIYASCPEIFSDINTAYNASLNAKTATLGTYYAQLATFYVELAQAESCFAHYNQSHFK